MYATTCITNSNTLILKWLYYSFPFSPIIYILALEGVDICLKERLIGA